MVQRLLMHSLICTPHTAAFERSRLAHASPPSPRTRFTLTTLHLNRLTIASHITSDTLHLHRLTMQVECLTHTLQFEPHICTSRASPQAAAMLVVVRVISHGAREHARSGAVATARVHLHASCLEWRRLRRRLQERPFRHLGLR